MNWQIVLGLARAEARLLRRLVRYWVFLVFSAILVLLAYFYYAGIHAFISSYSASVGSISPRYLIAGLGLWGMVLFLIGLIFFAFDVRARDQRERVMEVLDSRPYMNLELVTGRYLGILFMSWWPLAASMFIVAAVGWLGATFGWRLGEPVEFWSLFAFITLISIPALAFVLGLVFVFSLLLKNRLLTAVAIFAFLVTAIWILFRVPIDMVPMVDFIGGYTFNFPSDLVPQIFTFVPVVQRLSVLLLGFALLLFAAVLHPRLDGGRKGLWAAAGGVFLALAAIGFLLLYQQILDGRETFANWITAHEARQHDPAPDVERLTGEVVIRPGDTLTAELEIAFKAPPEAALEKALFTLNPGLVVTAAADANGGALDFTEGDGLVEIGLGRSLAAGESSSVRLSFSGRPDVTFGYLDSTLRLADLRLINANIILLGYDSAIFHSKYVALLPGVRWLPTAGADIGRGDRPTDYFELDLAVDLPEGWLAAGPARRRAEAGAEAGRVRYRFTPSATLPEAGLVAARFESRSAEVAGVELELLLGPSHLKNVEIFEEAGDEIRSWIAERFEEAAELGLPYPYDSLTMVEIPTTLRAFGGGWRMDSVLAPPAMLLIKETSFPTSRFDNRFRERENFEDREGGIARAKREVLEEFFEGDFNGGNIFLGVARNFFLYQTASHGDGSLALDFVCHDLANRVTTGKQGFFSAHIFGPDFQSTIQSVMINYFTGRREGVTITEAVLKAVADKPDVWEQALGVSLAEMDPWEDPARAVNVLALKGGAMARWLLDGMGRPKAAELLAAMRERATGRTFGHDELMTVASEIGIDFDSLAGDWLAQTELPGFQVAEPRLFRLSDSAEGTPRYQLALHIKNGEAAPGLLRLRYSLRVEEGEERSGAYWQETDPLRIAPGTAVEYGLVLSEPPARLQVAPYLALNRGAFAIDLPPLDEEKLIDAEPLVGVTPIDWESTNGNAIVVDDLDEGFTVEQDEKSSGFRLAAFGPPRELDQGLPLLVQPQPPNEWSRRPMDDAWGKYRHTMAVVKAGKGAQRAVFTTELPKAGPWRLELFLRASESRGRWKRGTYHLKVEDSSGSHDVEFDAGGAEKGWNLLGELEIASGEVRVTLSDETDGGAVVADAIRWRPVGSSRRADAETGD